MDDFDGDFEAEDSLDDDGRIEEEADDDMHDNDIAMEDAVFIGGTMMGWAYEEGFLEGKRRRLEKKMFEDQKNDDKENI